MNSFKANDGLDVTFIVENQEVKATQYILRSTSRVFQAMFDGEWKEAESDRIEIVGFSLKAMTVFIGMLHGVDYDIENDVSLGLELISLADKYEVKECVGWFAYQVSQKVAIDNVISILELGQQLNLFDLKKSASLFIQTRPVGKIDELPGYKSVSHDAKDLIVKALY